MADPFRLTLYFRDNNGKVAEMRVWLPETLSVQGAISFANNVASAAKPLSSASLFAADITYEVEFSPVNPPAIDSDVQRRLIAVYRNEAERYAIAIPSAGSLPYDLGGSLRAIRLGYDAAQVSGLLPALQGILAGSITPWGTPAPDDFVVAGISRNVL